MILYILVAINSCSPGLVTAISFHSPGAVQPLLDLYATPFRHASRLLHLLCGVEVLQNFRSFLLTRSTFARFFVVFLGVFQAFYHFRSLRITTSSPLR